MQKTVCDSEKPKRVWTRYTAAGNPCMQIRTSPEE